MQIKVKLFSPKVLRYNEKTLFVIFNFLNFSDLKKVEKFTGSNVAGDELNKTKKKNNFNFKF